MTIKNIEELFEIAGGAVHIAAKLKLHQVSVERWMEQGVPWKYWDELTKNYKITIEDLHEINKKIRNK